MEPTAAPGFDGQEPTSYSLPGAAGPAPAAPPAGPGKPAPNPAAPAATAPNLPPPPPTELNFFDHHLRNTLQGNSPDRTLAGMSLAESSTSLPVKMPDAKKAEEEYQKFVTSQPGDDGKPRQYNAQEKARFQQLYKSAANSYRDYQQGNYNSLAINSAFDNTADTAAMGLYTENRPNNVRRKLAGLTSKLELASGMSLGDPHPLSEIIKDAVGKDENVSSQTYVQQKTWQELVLDQHGQNGLLGKYDDKTKKGQRDAQGELVTEKSEWPGMFNGGVIVDVDEQGNVRPVKITSQNDVYAAPAVLSRWGYNTSDSGPWRFVSRLGAGIAGGAIKVAGTLQNLQQAGDEYTNNIGAGVLSYQYGQAHALRTGYGPLDQLLGSFGVQVQNPENFQWFSGDTLTDRLLGKGLDSSDSVTSKQLLLLGSQIQRGRAVDERGSIFANSNALYAGTADVAAQVVPQMAIGFLTGGIGAIGYAAADGYGATYKQFKEQGYTKHESMVAGTIAGLITGASEKMLNGSWIARLVKGNPAARELIEKPLVEMVQAATKEAIEELEKKGVQVTEQTLMATMAAKTPGLMTKFTNSMSALNGKLGRVAEAGAKKLGANVKLGAGDAPINWGDIARSMHHEGLQEVIEGLGQEGQGAIFDNFVFNGKIYDWLGLRPVERLKVDSEDWARRRENWSVKSMLMEQAESYVLGAAGGGIGEAPYIASAKVRENRRLAEERDLQLSLITHYVENRGQGMDALRARARSIGEENRWGTQLTTKGQLPKDGEPNENDVITQSVLNQIELLERLAHDSNLFARLKKNELTVQQAVGTLAHYVGQNDLYKRGLTNLLEERAAHQDRDNFLQSVLASPDGQPAAAGANGEAQSVLTMSPTQIQQERERRLAEAKQIQDADESVKKVNYLNQRYQTAQDTGAVGLIARFDGVYDYYEASRRVQEAQHKLDIADAADVAGVLELRAQKAEFDKQREAAAGLLSPMLANNQELARVKQLADKQLVYDNLNQRSRSVYDGTMVQDLTRESFLRKHYLDLTSLFADQSPGSEFQKLSVENRRVLEGQLRALNDPNAGFFNEKNRELKIDGATLRQLSFERKFKRAQLLLQEQQRNQVALDAQTSLNEVPNQILATAPTEETEATLLGDSQKALALAEGLAKGTVGFDVDQGKLLVDQLEARAQARLTPLLEAVQNDPQHSRQAFYERGLAVGDFLPDTPLTELDGYDLYLNEFLNQVNDPAALAARQAAAALANRLQNLQAFQPVPAKSDIDIEVLLGTSLSAASVATADMPYSDLSDKIAELLDMAHADPDALAAIPESDIDRYYGAVMRNLTLAELNDKVDNVLYDRMVAGKGVAVDGSIDGAKKIVARAQAEADREQAAVEAGAPLPEPETAGSALGKQGEKAAQALDDKSAPAEVAPVKSTRERIVDLLDKLSNHSTDDLTDYGQQVRAAAIAGNWFEKLDYVATNLFDYATNLAQNRLADWRTKVEQGSDTYTPEQIELQYTALLADAQRQIQQQLDKAVAEYPVSGVRMALLKLKMWVREVGHVDSIEWNVAAKQAMPLLVAAEAAAKQKNPAGAATASRLPSLGVLREIFAKIMAPLRVAFKRAARNAGLETWSWNKPMGPTENLHHQSLEVYAAIRAISRQQLQVLDEVSAVRAKALANRGIKDLQRRADELDAHTEKLLNAIIIPTSVLRGDSLAEQKLADAQAILSRLKKPQDLPGIGAYQLELHKAENLLREAFNTPARQQALASELHEEAQKVVLATGLQGVQPEQLVVLGWQQMLQNGPGVTEGTAYVLAALFGADRATVARHYGQWLSDTFPSIKDGKSPTPSLEQEDRVRQAVQLLSAPWPFGPDHLLTREAQADKSLFGLLNNAVFLTGFAGTGKTQMAGAPVVAIMAGLAGQRPGGGKYPVTTTAQFERQRQDITASVSRAATRVEVTNQNLDEVLAQLNDGTFAAPGFVVDEATILTRQQCQLLADGLRNINEQRRQQQQPAVWCLLLGDPAQLSGKNTASGDRMNRQHPLIETLVLPRLQPLKEIYRTGYVVLDNVQTDLRERVLSDDNDVRRNNDPLEGRYMMPTAGDYMSIAGLQYQGEKEQREQIVTHIKQLVASGSTQKLMVVVSDSDGKGVAAEVAALGALGVAHPEQYVVAIDQAQGNAYEFTYVAVNELTSDKRFSGNDNLRATLVGVSRSRNYASVRTRETAKINNRLENELTKFADNESKEKHTERGRESAARQEQNARLAALSTSGTAAPANATATPTATPQGAATPTQAAPATTTPTATAGGPASLADEQEPSTAAGGDVLGDGIAENRKLLAEMAGQIEELQKSLDEADPASPDLPALRQQLAELADQHAQLAAQLDEVEAGYQQQLAELSEEREQVVDNLQTALTQLPSSLPLQLEADPSLEESLDHQDVIEREGSIDEERVRLLREAQQALEQLRDLRERISQIGGEEGALALTQLDELLLSANLAITLEQAQQVDAQQAMLRVSSEDDLSKREEAPGQPVANLNDLTQERAPGIVVGQRIVGDQVLVGTIVAQVPIYNPVTGEFERMDAGADRRFEPDPTKSTLEQLNAARRFINQQIADIRASRIQFEKNRVATLAKEGKVVLHAALAPAENRLAQLWAKAGFLKRLLGTASTKADKSALVDVSWFDNYELSPGVRLRGSKGEGQFYLRYHETYSHGQEFPSDKTGELERNIFEVVYSEPVGNGASYEVSLGMVRREQLASQHGRIRNKYEKGNPLDDLFLAASNAPFEGPFQQVPLGKTVPLENVRPPAYFSPDADQDEPLRSVKEFRQQMADQNVGVSQPFVITISSHDDFINGNYSFYYGDLDEYGKQDKGGRKMLSGRAVVFTAYGYNQADLDRELEGLVRQGYDRDRNPNGLKAHEIVEILRTKYDAEMVLLNNRNTTLGHYASVVLGEAGGQVTTLNQLLMRRATTVYGQDEKARNGVALRSLNQDQKGFNSNPVNPKIAVSRSFFTTNQARFINTSRELAGEDSRFDRGGLINKFFNLFTDPDLGLMRNPGPGQPMKLTEKGLALLLDKNAPPELAAETSAELVQHLEHIVTLLRDVDAQRDSILETNEKGQVTNAYWNARYMPDLVLYLSYFDSQLDNQLSDKWTADEGNQIQVNPSFATKGRLNTFSPVFSLPSQDQFSDEAVMDMEDMLETRRTIKSAPSYVLNLQNIAESYQRSQAQGAATPSSAALEVPGAPPATPRPAPAALPATAATTPAAPPVAPLDGLLPPDGQQLAGSRSTPTAPTAPAAPAAGGRPGRGGRGGPSFFTNETESENGDLPVAEATALYNQLFGTQTSPWLADLLERLPWLKKIVQPLGIGLDDYWSAKQWGKAGAIDFKTAFGFVYQGVIQLNQGRNGLLQSLTPRHEALHYALQLLAPARRDQVLSWARVAWEQQGYDNAAYESLDAVEEWAADHYARLFERGDAAMESQLAGYRWLPAPLLRLFFNIRDLFQKSQQLSEADQLGQFFGDLETGRFRGQRVAREVAESQPYRLARSEAGLRDRAFESAAAVFGGRRRLQQAADWMQAQIYEFRHPTRLDENGQLIDPVRSDAKAVEYLYQDMYNTWQFSKEQNETPAELSFERAKELENNLEDQKRFTDADGFYHTPQLRALAHRLFAITEFSDGVESTTLKRKLVFQAIVEKVMQHVRGKLVIDVATGEIDPRGDTETSATASIYSEDDDAPGTSGQPGDSVLDSDQVGEAGSVAGESGADEENAHSQEMSINMGKEHYLTDRDKLPVESAELKYHIKMTPYLRGRMVQTPQGMQLIYEVDSQNLPVDLAYQLLREAAVEAQKIMSAQVLPDGTMPDNVTYAHWAQALGNLSRRYTGARGDVATSLLTRFFDHNVVGRDYHAGRYSLNPNPQSVAPSLFEQAFSQATGRPDLRGNQHAAEAGRIVSQLYGFYNSLKRRNIVDVDTSGDVSLANDVTDGLEQLKNQAHSSIVNALFSSQKQSGTWQPRLEVLERMAKRGFVFVKQPAGQIALARRNPALPSGSAPTILFMFGEPRRDGKNAYGYANNSTGHAETYQADPQFYADAVYDLLAETGFKLRTTRRAIRDLISERDVNGQVVGTKGFAADAGKYMALLLQPLLLEHLQRRNKSPRQSFGAAALARLGIEKGNAVEEWFSSPFFTQQPKDDLNAAVGKAGRVEDKHFSPTKSYSELTSRLINLLTASQVQPERLNAYNYAGNRISLLQHANSLYHQLAQLTTEIKREFERKKRGSKEQVHPGWFYSLADRYSNPVRRGLILHEADDVLLTGVLSDKRTGRKHQLTGASFREFTRVGFEKFFLQELADSQGTRLIIFGSPKADKETQTAHRLRLVEGAATQLLYLSGTPEAAQALQNVQNSYAALLRHNVMPRIVAASNGQLPAAPNLDLDKQLEAAESWLKSQSPAQLAKLPLVKGVDYDVAKGQVTGVGKLLRQHLTMPQAEFVASMQQSLEFEAAELHAQGFTYFDKALADQMLAAVNSDLGSSLKDFVTDGGGGYKVRIQDKVTGEMRFNPLVTSFLLTQLVQRHSLETALAGSDVLYKTGSVAGGDAVDYTKRLIQLTTNYEAYDLNAYGGLPAVSQLAILNTETLADILSPADYLEKFSDETKTQRDARLSHLGSRYFYRDAQGTRVNQRTVSTDQGQFFGVLLAMAPGATQEAREDWAREKIESQDLFDGLQFSTMLHDFQHLRSGLQPQYDESQRKTLYGGLMPDGLPALNKTSTTRITNELLENGNQYLWAQLIGMMGGSSSPLYQQWQQIRQELATQYGGTDSPQWRSNVIRGNEDWKKLAEAVRKNPSLEQHHIGLLSFGLKVGNAGRADTMSGSYRNALRQMSNKLGGTVLSLSQELTQTDIANITQENYIFSLQGLNWQTTEAINENLGRLSAAGLVDMQELHRAIGGEEMFKRRAQEMLDNMGNVSNTNAMLGARLDANLPLLATVMGTAIASQVKAKMTKLRFAGARFTVSCSSGRVNMYEVDGVGAMTARQLVREGYATRNELGQLVPVDGRPGFAVRELAFTHYRHKGENRILTAEEANEFAGLVKAGSEGDAEAAAEAEALAQNYEMAPMEVMVSRDAFKQFAIPQELDFDQVSEQYFYQRSFNELALARLKAQNQLYADPQLRQFMAEAADDRPVDDGQGSTAEFDSQRAAAYSEQEVADYRNQVFETAVSEAERAGLDAQAREMGADLWKNFQQRAEMKVTRIPVTGLNSIQISKVVGFYDSQANTMLLPAQVQTVAGADNDGDMVTVEYHDVDRKGLSYTDADVDGRKGQVRNQLRETKMKALRNPLNILQLFHPIDFAGLKVYKQNAINLDAALAVSDARAGGLTAGYGPMGHLYRFAPSIATLIKNQQGKSGVGPFVKLSQLYYQNVALLKSLAGKQRLGKKNEVLGDLREPINYGQYQITSTMQREVATANLLENVANGSLDNAKEDLLGWLNVNPQMWGAYSAMMFAQVPEAEIFRLLSHPYAKQIAEVAQRSRDVDATYTKSVAEVCRAILTGDVQSVRINENGDEEVIATGGMNYDTFKKNQQQAAREDTRLRDAARAAVLAEGGTVEAAELAAASIEESDVATVRSLRTQVAARLSMVTEVPQLENITKRRPKNGDEDHEVRRFVVEQLYLFSLRGDELLEAQGVLRALEGPPGNEFDALRMFERVLTGLGYAPGKYKGSVDQAILALKQGLLADVDQEGNGTWPQLDEQGRPTFNSEGKPVMMPGLTENARYKLAQDGGGELLNMRVHLLGNPALNAAVRGLIFDYEQRREQFITRQPVVMTAFKKLMAGNRSFYLGKGSGTLLREFRAWLDSRYLREHAQLRVDATIQGEGLAYLQDLADCELTSLVGQQEFMERTADYIASLKNRLGEPGRPDIGSLGLVQELVPRDNEFGRVVTLNNSENLDASQKAVLQSEYEELAQYGAEGLAVQQVLFTYALISRGLNVGKGSLAELISPAAARPYSDFLQQQRNWFADPANHDKAAGALAAFSREFQLFNPSAAPELRKSKGVDENQETYKRSFFGDREIDLSRDRADVAAGEKKDVLPLVVHDFQVKSGNFRYSQTAVADLPPILSVPNRAAMGGFAVYELVPITRTVGFDKKPLAAPLDTFQYERRFSAATPQLNVYGMQEAVSALPVLPLAPDESQVPATELLANPKSEFSQSVRRLMSYAASNTDLTESLKSGTPVLVASGETVSLREQYECKAMVSS